MLNPYVRSRAHNGHARPLGSLHPVPRERYHADEASDSDQHRPIALPPSECKDIRIARGSSREPDHSRLQRPILLASGNSRLSRNTATPAVTAINTIRPML